MKQHEEMDSVQCDSSRFENDIMYYPTPCECGQYIHIDDELHRFRCPAATHMETDINK